MGHTIIRPYNTKDTHLNEPNIIYNNELCQAIRADNHVFLRGQVGATFDGKIIGVGDASLQTEQAMKNVKVLLEEAGSRLEHIVKMMVFVTDWIHREPVYRVLGEQMRGIRYCSTGVTVASLARPEWVVEIDVHAIIPQDELEREKLV